MKVSIPTKDENGLDGIVEQHFGKAPTYTIIDTETGKITVIPNTSEHMGGVGLPPEYLHQNGWTSCSVPGLGPKPLACSSPTGLRFLLGLAVR